VTAAIGANPGGSTLGGNPTAQASQGVATFTTLALDEPGDGYTLQAGASGLTSGTTAAFIVTSRSGGQGTLNAPTQIVITTEPSGSSALTAGSTFTVVAALENNQGLVQVAYNGTVSIALASGPSGASLGGTTTVTVNQGVATFSDLALDQAAGGYTLQISSSGLPSIATGSFAVAPAAPSQLVITSQPPSSVTVGQSFGLTVAVEDQYGNVATEYNGDVMASSGGAALGGTTTVAAVRGIATFTNLTLNQAGSGLSLQISAPGLPSTGSGSIVATGSTSGGGGGPQSGGGGSNGNSSSGSSSGGAAPTIMGESVLMARKTNKKGKPVGKATLSGFVLQYSAAMDPARAGSSSNYTVDATTVKRVKHKKVTITNPVAFAASYDPVKHTVTLTLAGKQTFAQGGQITVIYTPPGGVDSQQGVPLSSGSAQFTIQPKAKGVSAG
jgi:hypothetical protein